MLVLQKALRSVCFLFLLLCSPSYVYSANASTELLENGIINQKNGLVTKSVSKTHKKLSYYLYIQDFVKSFIEIPTANVSVDSSTISSKYLAGRAPIYNKKNKKAGVCSASFLCMQNADGIFTDISNYLSINNGLIVSWFTPTRLSNLELDSIVRSMVTKCLVKASTKIGFNPYYRETFDLVVSSDSSKIYFNFTRR